MDEATTAGRPLSAGQLWINALVGARAVRIATLLLFGGGACAAIFLRLWHLNQTGYNSDEAVYAGQGAALANDPELTPFFPVFRAHPLLFQTILSIGYRLGGGDLMGRSLSAAFGFGTIVLVFLIGRLLYGKTAGLIAALLIALMPYDVLVSRQVLLDGPMTFFSTLALYLVALYATTLRRPWLYAAGAAMGLTILTKETSVLAVGSLFAFFALSPEVRTRTRDLCFAALAMMGVALAYPLALRFAGGGERGQNYLVWQLLRRPNHEWSFYPATVPPAIGPLVIAAALAGLWLLRRQTSWRETLFLCWIVVPAVFFQLWPVKGYQYLLPAAPPIALLAGRTLALWRPSPRVIGRVVPSAAISLTLVALVASSIAYETWHRIKPARSGTFLAGSGGIPGGREMGHWVRANTPEGSEFLAVGPSMANLVSFYGHRKAYGISVGTNPARRNPAYEPIDNPDLAIRRNDLQYIVWDAYSASRTPFFSEKLMGYVHKYNGLAIHTESVEARTAGGRNVPRPVIIVYEVHR